MVLLYCGNGVGDVMGATLLERLRQQIGQQLGKPPLRIVLVRLWLRLLWHLRRLHAVLFFLGIIDGCYIITKYNNIINILKLNRQIE
jgi:hypothetical protein